MKLPFVHSDVVISGCGIQAPPFSSLGHFHYLVFTIQLTVYRCSETHSHEHIGAFTLYTHLCMFSWFLLLILPVWSSSCSFQVWKKNNKFQKRKKKFTLARLSLSLSVSGAGCMEGGTDGTHQWHTNTQDKQSPTVTSSSHWWGSGRGFRAD